MDHVPGLPAKLDMLLKGLSLSRVALAQRLGVDKSLVGRWLAGSVHPTEHNLARLTAIVAEGLPAFRLSDWYEDSAILARRYGLAPPAPAQASALLPGEPLKAFIDAARGDLDARGSAYEGLWRTARPSLLMSRQVFHDYGLIRRREDGLIEVLMGGSGLDFAGYLFPIGSNIVTFLYDPVGRSPLTVLCKGVSLPRAMTVDGIVTLAALDPDRTPAAMPIVVERVGDLSGDREADLATWRAIAEEARAPLEPVGEEALQARLFRGCGPEPGAPGGEAFLSVGSAASLSRGSTGKGLAG